MNGNLNMVYNRGLKELMIFIVLLFLLPFFVTSSYFISILILVGLYTIVCTGLTMLMGYAGQISLGHAAFYGIGAYSSAFLTAKMGMPGWAGIVVGALLAALVAYVVGIPTLKLTGHYLALATLGFGVIVFILFKELKIVTGGLDGFSGIAAFQLGGIEFDSDTHYYYLIWLIALIGIVVAKNIIQSRVGRALRSIQSSEIASDSVGVDIQKYKLQVFAMSAVYTSVAGSIYAHYMSFINPMLFDTNTSINFLIMAVVGGSGSIWGGFVGALVFVMLGEVLKEVIPFFSDGGQFEIVFFGALLVVLLIYMPEGLAPGLERIKKRFFKSKKEVEKVKCQEAATGVVAGGER